MGFAGMPRSLRQAYEAAEYCLWVAGAELILRVGEHDIPAMERLQRHAGMRRRGFIITPCNPGSQRLAHADNRQRLQAFRGRLDGDGMRWLPAVTRDPAGDWPDEPGALLMDCGETYAKNLATAFGQNALLAFTPAGTPQLLWLV